jgi:hypothetical protein
MVQLGFRFHPKLQLDFFLTYAKISVFFFLLFYFEKKKDEFGE